MKKIWLSLIISIAVILSAEVIIDEDFTGTFPPAGWTTTGGTNWQQGTGNFAGGVAPEARFYWTPSATSIFRLISHQIDTTGGTTLQLNFKHYVDHFSGTYTLRVQTTSDGVNWNNVWNLSPTGNVGPETLAMVVDTPDVGSPNFQIAWVFDGYSWNINNWYVDDIFLEGQLVVYDNDLAGMTITGNTIVNAGNTENYHIIVKNVGNNPQTTYTVKLFKEYNIELASLDVVNTLEPEQQATHTLVWQIPINEPQGTVTLYGRVFLAGDENPNNDNTNNLPVSVFPPGIIEINIGSGTELNNRTPIRFQYKNSLTESLFFPDELSNITGMITGVKYYSNFSSNLNYKPVTIWAGQTTLNSLVDGWIPASQLIQVFDGNVYFPTGQNVIYIEFDTPYFYDGNNLVIMVHRPMDTTGYGTTDYFLHSQTTAFPSRTRYEADDTIICDPFNPPTGYSFDKFANISVTFFQGAMGNAEGYVRDDLNNPLAGADVLIEELNMTSYTNDEGYYYFGNVLVGNYAFTANKFGYSPQTVQGEILEDQTTVIDFVLPPLGIVNVSGHVVGSDFPEIGLAGAQVSVTGFSNYLVYTDDNGDFEITGVYTNITYDLSISHEGYDVYNQDLVVGAVNLDLGTLILQEITIPPGNVTAIQNLNQTQVDLTWTSPGQGGGEFRYDDGEVNFQIGFSSSPANGVFGAAHPYIAVIQEVRWFLTSTYGSHNNVKILILGLDNNDMPDVGQLYLISNLIPNVDDEWNSLLLDNQITAPNGFFVGVITPSQYTSLGLDDGVGEPWVFQPNTQFSNENWLAGNDWSDIGSAGVIFHKNMMIRAYGINMGHTRFRHNSHTHFQTKENNENRSFESYNVYRFPDYFHNSPLDWSLIATAVTDTFFTDASWAALPIGNYQFAITAVHTNSVESLPAFSQILNKTMVNNNPEVLPEISALHGNYPNPFNPETTISFSIAAYSPETELVICNLKGQKVRTLIRSALPPGDYHVHWDGKDDHGHEVASGLYFYRLKTEKYVSSRKMLLLR